MQFPASRKIAVTKGAARMIIRRQRIADRTQGETEGFEDLFDIAFHIVKIEISLRLMDTLRTKASRSGHDKRAPFAVLAIDFPEFIEPNIANAAVRVPFDCL